MTYITRKCPDEWQPKILLKLLRGSKAYGLANDSSDTDTSIIYIQPTIALLSLYEPHKFEKDKSEDSMAWELKHFLDLATNGNPSVLEAFLAPVLSGGEEAQELRRLFPHVLRKDPIFNAFAGIAHGNRLKMFEDPKEYRRRKAGANCLRLFYNGAELLTEGTFTVRIADTEIGAAVKAAKEGYLSPSDVLLLASDLEAKLKAAYSSSKLPVECNLDPLNKFLLDVRGRHWEQ